MSAVVDINTQPTFDLQIFISAGPNEVPKATIGFATALAAAVSGEDVVVFLTGPGAYWASKDHGDVESAPGFDSVASYMEMLWEADARIEGCTACLVHYRDQTVPLHEGVIEAGLSVAAIRMQDSRTVVF